jgi:hypothetical protein
VARIVVPPARRPTTKSLETDETTTLPFSCPVPLQQPCLLSGTFLNGRERGSPTFDRAGFRRFLAVPHEHAGHIVARFEQRVRQRCCPPRPTSPTQPRHPGHSHPRHRLFHESVEPAIAGREPPRDDPTAAARWTPALISRAAAAAESSVTDGTPCASRLCRSQSCQTSHTDVRRRRRCEAVGLFSLDPAHTSPRATPVCGIGFSPRSVNERELPKLRRLRNRCERSRSSPGDPSGSEMQPIDCHCGRGNSAKCRCRRRNEALRAPRTRIRKPRLVS